MAIYFYLYYNVHATSPFVKTTQQISLGILVTVGCNVVQPLENIESISHKDNPVAIADMPTKVHNAASNVLK